MQFHFKPGTSALIAAILTAVAWHYALAQDAQSHEVKGLPPRITPAEYQAQAQAGSITIAADFMAHSVPASPDAIYTTEDYLVVEVGLFGPSGAHLPLNYGDFSLRINGKKTPLPAQPYALAFKSLKDPTYLAPELAEAKSNGGGLSTGGGGRGGQPDGSNLPPVVHIPIGMERAMQQKVQKASLPEGDRPLPAAGLIFFERHGKITSAELLYAGPAGKASLKLQP